MSSVLLNVHSCDLVLGMPQSAWDSLDQLSGRARYRDQQSLVVLDDLPTADELQMRQRAHCETDPSFRQVIPYVTLGIAGTDIVLAYQRVAGEERRLSDRWSIGVGGHINPEDIAAGVDYGVAGQLTAAVLHAMFRELYEELPEFMWELLDPAAAKFGDVTTPAQLSQLRPTCWIDYRGDSVGCVHVGAWFELKVDAEKISQLFPDGLDSEVQLDGGVGRFMEKRDILAKLGEQLEPWSKAVLCF